MRSSTGRGSSNGITHHGLNLLLVVALLQSLLELILGGNVGGIVLVYLSPQSAPWSSPF
jgi:hypothetical protein